tara:strand:+ start:189 stop:515 length:327 start_codon:yes stop_codon:yes gene_type:complete
MKKTNIRIFQGILTQAIQDALYTPDKEDKRKENDYLLKLKEGKVSPKKFEGENFRMKRDALNWLYGHDKDDLWLLELCCDLSNLSQDRVIQKIEKYHRENGLSLNAIK